MRMLHTMLRVRDLEKSLHFYLNILEMKLLRQKEYPSGEYTLAFVGYQPESEGPAIELTYNWGKNKPEDYELGNAFGHIAIEVDDVYKACDDIEQAGGEIVRPAGPNKHSPTVLAFVKDPDGYMIELLESRQ